MTSITLDAKISASMVTVMPLLRDSPNITYSHRLFIKDCSVQTWIGVYEHERKEPTILVFNIELDVDARRIELLVDDAEIARRLAELAPPAVRLNIPATGYRRLYQTTVTQAVSPVIFHCPAIADRMDLIIDK